MKFDKSDDFKTNPDVISMTYKTWLEFEIVMIPLALVVMRHCI